MTSIPAAVHSAKKLKSFLVKNYVAFLGETINSPFRNAKKSNFCIYLISLLQQNTLKKEEQRALTADVAYFFKKEAIFPYLFFSIK